MDMPIIEQVKIQARALVPLIKALQAELGEERANAIASHCDFRYALEKPGESR